MLMILVLCTSASFITEYAAKRLALQEEARLEADKADNSWLMLTVAENRHYELQELSELGELHDADFASESDWSEAKKLINSQHKAAIVYHPSQPLNTINRLLVAVPRYAEKEHDFISCFGLVRRLSSQLGAKVVFYTNEDTQRALQAFCRRKGKYLRASYREMENWEDVLMIAKQMAPDDSQLTLRRGLSDRERYNRSSLPTRVRSKGVFQVTSNPFLRADHWTSPLPEEENCPN